MPWQLTRLATLIAILLPLHSPAAPDILVADFEGEDYGEWVTTGEAFGPGPAQGTLPNQMPVSGFAGKGLVNSFYGGDGPTGTLTSPRFTIERKYMHFLVGGGKYPGETCINLIIDENVIRTATGPNDKPGGSERLDWRAWDVSDLLGKSAKIQIVDQRNGGWGHINVDHILQSDDATKEITMDIQVEKRYLNIPVRQGGPMQRLQVLTGGNIVREFEVELADSEPDFWVFLDLSPFQGQSLTVKLAGVIADADALAGLSQDDAIKGSEKLYKEALRPQLHFTSRRGWNNDPNGLVYYKGEYHLFYQHNPYGWSWGNMHWGHAVSPDLIHWTELPIAIYPHQFGDWVFSGSAAVDWNNSAGFKTGDEDVIVAAYTSTGRGEAIAFSSDRGRTFTDYEGNPVVKHQGRDPKIIWYEPGGHWVMAVYDELEGSQGIAFHTSTDLKTWEFQSRIEGYYECPEIFEMAVEGNRGEKRWIVYGANGEYSIGSFDGKTFAAESGKHRLNYGNCFYASQTFSDIPAEDGRRIQIAWGQAATPGMPFNQMMDFPVELTLRNTGEGLRMFAEPIREIELLHDAEHVFNDLTVAEGDNPLSEISSELFHIIAEFEPPRVGQVGLYVRGIPVIYDSVKHELSCQGRGAPVKPENGVVKLELIADRTSIEIYANDGSIYMPMTVVPAEGNRLLEINVRGGQASIKSLRVYELRSAWE